MSDDKPQITTLATLETAEGPVASTVALDPAYEEARTARPSRPRPVAAEPESFIPESVDQLLAHSRRYPLLTPEQEIELAKRIERGDLYAKELLVNSNLRLVA